MIFLILAFLIGITLIKVIPEKQRYWLMTISLLAIVLLGFGIGTDYFSYEYLYDTFNPLKSDSMEIGFKTIYYLARSQNISFHTLAFIIRGLILTATALWIYQSSENKSLSLIIYYCMFFYIWTMSSFRQGLTLALGSYFFINQKKDISIKNKLIIIFLLSTIHLSALFYIIVLTLTHVNWDKRKQLIFLGVALVSTFIPVSKILEHLVFIPGVSSALYYASNTIGFFDFPSIMRLFFFMLIFISYDKITVEKYNKKIADIFLNGISIYFILKFAEITAARLTIYSFILIVLLLPLVVDIFAKQYIKQLKFVSVIGTVLVLSMSTVILAKDFVAYKSQVSYVGNMNTFNFKTIFNKEYGEFDTFFATYQKNRIKNAMYLNEYKEANVESLEKEFYENEEFIVVPDRASGKYGVMSSSGKWAVEPTFESAPVLYKDILVTKEPNILFEKETKFDIRGVITDPYEIDVYISEVLSNQYASKKYHEEETNYKFADVIENPQDFVPSIDSVKEDRVVKIQTDGITYHILYYTSFGYGNFIYLDENLKPMSNIIHNKQSMYENGFLKATALSGTAVYNRKGELIWFY